MTTMELQQWKLSFIEKYLDKIDSVEIMAKLERSAKRIMSQKESPRPCIVRSQEEMIAAVREATTQIERGEYVTDDELSKDIDSWW